MLRRQEPVGLLIAAALRGVKLAVRRHSRALGLTSQQFWFINAARELPGASLGEIARRQHMDAPTASRLADGLARRGMIRTAPDDRDRRALVRGMSRRQQDALRASLRQVLANVQTFAAEADGEDRRPHDGGEA